MIGEKVVPDSMLIQEEQALVKYLEDILSSSTSYLTCDTEFIRQKTFYPEVCLIQCADQGHTYLIDTLAINPKSIAPLFFDHSKILVFHSCKQDVEIIYYLYGKIPPSLFDSQIAGQFVGLGESISYEGLVRTYLNLDIDKSQQHTDWKKRPLSQKQLDYAASDVTHLFNIYPLLIQNLENRGYLNWALSEMVELSDPSPFDTAPLHRVLKLNIPSNKRPFAMALFNIREAYARRLNVNRTLYLSDTSIEHAAKCKDVGALREFIEKVVPSFGERATFLEEIVECLHKANLDLSPPHEAKMTQSQEMELNHLRNFRDKQSEKLNLPKSLLSTTSDLKEFVLHQKGRIRTSWRWEIFEGAF